MKRVIQLLIVFLFFSGCVTQRACYNKFPPVIGVTDTVTFRDTIYVFNTVRDTVYSTTHLTDTVHASVGTADGSAWVLKDSIYIRVIQKDTVFKYLDSIRTEIREITKVVEKPCEGSPVLRQLITILIILVILSGFFLIRKLIK